MFNTFYYIDTSVLLENIPLVTFIKTTSGTRVVLIIFHNLTSEFIDDIISVIPFEIYIKRLASFDFYLHIFHSFAYILSL